ncbi:MAG: hypothetical protein KDK70_04010 [Myxococcales bacterium]|nr:hypothetical protein [Myxococcales bacterium]
MAIQAGKTMILALGVALGVTACDQADERSSEAATSWRTGVVDNGGHLTLNTNAWIPASARDLHEFRDNGDVYVSSYGYETKLMGVSHPSTAYGAVSSPAMGSAPAGVASIRLRPGAEVEVEVKGPQAGDTEYVLRGEDLVGLELSFDMKDPEANWYSVVLEVVGHMVDESGNDLYELDRVDPVTGNHVSLCEQSAAYGRFARITSGLHIEGETGDVDIAAPSLRHIGCIASVPAKAMLLGYAATAETYDEFVLATRVVRADYCADGHPYTYPGNLFATDDNLDGPKTLAEVEAAHDGQVLEAVWDVNGVLCVGTPRADNTSRTDVVCPTKHWADGTITHNWQPPSCADFVDTGAPGELRLYSFTGAPEEPEA